jgi:hypothetical protein
MAAARDTDLSYDPIIMSASTSGKSTGPQVIYSPDYVKQKAAQVMAKFPNSNPMAVNNGAIAVSKISKTAEVNRSLQTLFESGVADKTLMEGFMEMGKDYKDWASIQNKNGLTSAQLEMVKAAHAKYFGLSTDQIASMPTTPAKKPNYLLWGAIAVGGFFLVRKLIK